jgi:anthranilate synthase component 1
MFTLPYDHFLELTKESTIVPVYREVLVDTETPVSAYLKIRGRDRYSFLLESVEGGEKVARYSFLGVDPFLIFRSRGRSIDIEDRRRRTVERFEGDPIMELRRLTERYRSPHLKGLPRFTGGAVGYLAYDAVRLVEKIPDTGIDDLSVDDVVFMFFDTILAFDNIAHKGILISNVQTDGGDLRAKYEGAVRKLDDLQWALRQPVDLSQRKGSGKIDVRSNTEKAGYLETVRRCKEYIAAGDIFQVVPSQRFATPISVGSFDIYRMLRVVNPSPYMFHITLGNIDLVGASPELLVRVEDGKVTIRPIAGTRRRGETEEEDLVLEHELLTDEKERAEHLMLVDLGRNDVGRVALYASVKVTEFMIIERYSHVMHIVSNVEGRLKPGMDRFDALFAGFPAGTVSGAPKIRAMEIIDEMEPTRRGVYAGAVGYIDFSGNLDTCIALRTMVIRDGMAYVQAGGGVVADSVPESEYQETVNKARALIRAIEMAEGSV